MQFKFKIQPYQTAAADAVSAVFEGQPKNEPYAYMRDLGVMKRGQTNTASMFAYSVGQSDEGYGNAPLVLDGNELLCNINRVQSRNQLEESSELSDELGACQLDIEMETGTGKTYVYTKTMFELNRLYGWTKFIIVVPSIAIREV